MSKGRTGALNNCCFGESGTIMRVSSGSSIDRRNSSAYNDQKKKEDTQMSFVGLQINPKEKKVIAFADSKLSTNYNGRMEQNNERPCMNKIFSTDQYIAVSHNVASFYGENIIDEIFLDDYMEKRKHDELETILNDIWKQLWIYKEQNPMYFIYIKKGEYGFYHKVILTEKEMKDSKINVIERKAVFGGAATYVELANCDPRFCNGSEKEIEEAMREYIEFHNHLPYYNSVGGNIKVVSWNWV